MSYYKIKLKAGVPFRHNAAGRLILLDSTGTAPSVNIRPLVAGSDGNQIPDRKAGFRIVTPFEGVEYTAPVDCDIGVFMTSTDVSNGLTEGSQVSVSGQVEVSADPSTPLPVEIASGTVELTATNVGINNNLTTITDFSPGVIGTSAALLVSDPTQKRLRIRNGHSTAVVGIGGPLVTMANAAIQLQPGDTWIEDDAPGADWYAVSDTAATNVQVQGLK